jgi:hypothetical protein
MLIYLDMILFIFLISIRVIFSNIWFSLIYFSCTWFFQILHNALSGTKPPMSFNFIMCITIGKLFPPVKKIKNKIKINTINKLKNLI